MSNRNARHLHLTLACLEGRYSPAVFTVTNVSDSGSGSLRQAVIAANSSNGTDTIAFEPTFFSVPRSITLLTGRLTINESVVISGPGSELLSVSGNKSSGVFLVTGFATITSTISGLSVRDAANQRAISLEGVNADLVLSNCAISGSSAGAISLFLSARLTVQHSTISGNSSQVGAPVQISDPTRFVVENSCLTGNIGGAGGAIRVYGVAPTGGIIIRNSTLSGNATTGDGGAILLEQFSGSLKIQNSTIVNNKTSGNFGGGGIARISGSGVIEIESSIVASNVHTTGDYEDLFSGGTIKATVSAIGTAKFVSGFQPDSTTTGLLGADFKLGPLANNGGLTQTHALLSGSPCINAGSNPTGLGTDQRGPGFLRTANLLPDIGAFEVQGTPPSVVDVQVNSGQAQRSNVTRLKVAFSEPVTLLGGAFELSRVGPGSPIGLVGLQVSGGDAAVELTFSASGGVGVTPSGSLIDGRYLLRIRGDRVFGAGGYLDGDGDGTVGGDYLTPASGPNSIHRLFGDADGDADVDAADFAAFRGAFGSTGITFDADGDGDVDAADFAAFRSAFGSGLP